MTTLSTRIIKQKSHALQLISYELIAILLYSNEYKKVEVLTKTDSVNKMQLINTIGYKLPTLSINDPTSKMQLDHTISDS